jgi:hypothetical protein
MLQVSEDSTPLSCLIQMNVCEEIFVDKEKETGVLYPIELFFFSSSTDR